MKVISYLKDLPYIHCKVKEIENPYAKVILDCSYDTFIEHHFQITDLMILKSGQTILKLPVCRHRTDVDLRMPFIHLDKKNNRVVLTSFYGKFAYNYQISVGDEIRLFLYQKRGYKKQYDAHQYPNCDDRNNYTSDEAFANFREVCTGDIPSNTLYRGSNPIGYDFFPNRSLTAATLFEKYQIASVINTENTESQLQVFLNKNSCPLYNNLWKKNKIFHEHLTTDVTSEQFTNGIIHCLHFMKTAPKPIYLHCNQGKNRTGYLCAWIQALTGSSYDEIIDEFMLSYEYLHHLEKRSRDWKILAKSNILNYLSHTFLKHWKNRKNPKAAAIRYLTERGATEEGLLQLIEHLSEG